MQITLGTRTHLKITWPLYDAAIESQIRERLATVPGIEAGHGRIAWAPVIQLARLTEIFPKASLDYAAIQESSRVAHTFWDSMVLLGIIFRIDASGAVYVDQESNSPVIEQLVAERSHAIKPFVEEAMKHPVPILRGPLPQIPPARQVEEVRYPRRKSRAKKEKVK